jgi:capsid protein
VWLAQGALLGVWGAEVPDGQSHVPPAHEMIDPLKDTTALIAQLRAGFVPWPEAVGAFGQSNFRSNGISRSEFLL